LPSSHVEESFDYSRVADILAVLALAFELLKRVFAGVRPALSWATDHV